VAATDPLERLDPDTRATLAELVAVLTADRRAPSSVRDPADAWRVHVADSLTGLALEPLAEARRIADVGSGAGLPGLVLATALPDARVDLIESIGRKCDFARAAIERTGIEGAKVVCERSEDWARQAPPAGGREAYDAVAARAVGRLATLAELASPLLPEGGALVAWKGRRDPDEEAELSRASEALAMAPRQVLEVGESAGYENRHLYVVRKSGRTPENLPRRPGVAKKRPYGSH
jgi:16S rRNA (guanine527-N7)-methyltransferase